MKSMKCLLTTVGFLAITSTSAPALAGSDDLRDALRVLGGFAKAVKEIKDHRDSRKSEFTCVARAFRNRGRDVRQVQSERHRDRARPQNVETMRQVCIRALQKCMDQFQNRRRGRNQCFVARNRIDNRRHGQDVVHRFNDRTIRELRRGR